MTPVFSILLITLLEIEKMEKLTKEQAIAITGFTGVCCCNFGDFQLDVEKRRGPTFTHEFGSEAIAAEIKELYREDFLALCPD